MGGGAGALAAGAERGGELGLGDDEDERERDQGGDDRVEGLGGQCEQQDRAGQAADEGGEAEAEDPARWPVSSRR